jgi:adenylate kinase family enzyme
LYARSDDSPETAKKRIIEQGNGAVGPILDFYRKLGTLVSVDGEPPIDKVNEEVEKVLQ